MIVWTILLLLFPSALRSDGALTTPPAKREGTALSLEDESAALKGFTRAVLAHPDDQTARELVEKKTLSLLETREQLYRALPRERDAALIQAERALRARSKDVRQVLEGVRASFEGQWRESSRALLSTCRSVDFQWQINRYNREDERPAQEYLSGLCRSLEPSAARDDRPREIDVHRVAGFLALYREEREQVISEWTSALTLDPEDTGLSGLLAQVKNIGLRSAQRSQAAEKATLAEKHLASRQWEEAQFLLREAIDLDPDNPDIRDRLTQVEESCRRRRISGKQRKLAFELEKQGNTEEALNVWIAILQNDPLNTEASAKVSTLRPKEPPSREGHEPRRVEDRGKAQEFYALGLLSYAEGRLTEARSAFQTCLKWSPGFEQARRALDRLNRKNP